MQGNESPVFDHLPWFHKKRRNVLKNLGLEKEADVTKIQITSQVMGTQMLPYSQIPSYELW
jgi:hypothetical protein